MSKPTVKLYFKTGSEEAAKDLASRVRNDGADCHLLNIGHFKEPGDCESCHAVLIQKSSPKTELVQRSYRGVYPETEIHLFDDDGEIEDEDGSQETESEDAGSGPETETDGADSGPTGDGTEPEEGDSGAGDSAPDEE